MIRKIYDEIIKRIEDIHIKKINNIDGDLFLISTAYPGVWLEHVYDSIIYAKLFDKSKIAYNTINAFIDLQKADGQYPCFIKEDNIGFSQIQECVAFIRLAFMAYEMVSDKEFLIKIYNSGKKWISWLEKNRMTLGLGLVEMFVGYDTGHDNSGRLDDIAYKGYYEINGKRANASLKPDCDIAPIIAVDMNANFYSNLKTLAKIAHILEYTEEEIFYDNYAKKVKKRLFKYCFNEEDVFFYDLDKNGKQRKYLSSTIFHLFLENVLDKDEDEKLIAKIYNLHLKNEKEFYTPYPFPSMAVSDKSWLSHKMPNSWGYYSEALIALRCSLWMDQYGFNQDYDYILSKWIDGLVKNYEKYPMAQELDPLTCESSGASVWYSSSMLLYIYGIRRLKLL